MTMRPGGCGGGEGSGRPAWWVWRRDAAPARATLRLREGKHGRAEVDGFHLEARIARHEGGGETSVAVAEDEGDSAVQKVLQVMGSGALEGWGPRVRYSSQR